MFATGYEPSAAGFLDPKALQLLGYNKDEASMSFSLYKHTFHPQLPNLAVIGQTKGLYFVSTEMQTKWAAEVFGGGKSLPSNEVMMRELDQIQSKRDELLKLQFPYGGYSDMVDELAQAMGAMPDLKSIQSSDPHTYDMLWNNCLITDAFFSGHDSEYCKSIMNEIDRISKQVYWFGESQRDDEFVSSAKMAELFASKNKYNIPFGVFKAWSTDLNMKHFHFYKIVIVTDKLKNKIFESLTIKK